VSVRLSARISPESHSRSLPNFLCMLPVSVARSSSDVYDRPHRLSPGRGFSSPLKMHYRPGNGDGSAQRERSMLSTIAVLFMCIGLQELFMFEENTKGTRGHSLKLAKMRCTRDCWRHVFLTG